MSRKPKKEQKEQTVFEKAVYKAVRSIPSGQVRTYKEVADFIGRPKAARAVGNALKKNYDSLVPCYRVVLSNNKFGFYNRGREKKAELLKKEGINFLK